MKKLALVALLLVSGIATAQKMKVIKGDFKNLKGISEYKLEFDYNEVKIDKFKTEEEFLEAKMKKRDDEEGSAEEFKKNWFADRENRYEPKFIDSFNKRFDGGEVKADKNLTSAKHIMKVKTTWIYPGFNAGVVRKGAKVNATIYIYDAADPSKELLVVSYDESPGNGAMGADFNSGYRISESYAKLAKEFAGHIQKKAK